MRRCVASDIYFEYFVLEYGGYIQKILEYGIEVEEYFGWENLLIPIAPAGESSMQTAVPNA